jgi:hypothetical protein
MKTPECPLYLYLIFAVAFLFVAYLVANWIATKVGFPSKSREMYTTNPKYTYIPSSAAPNTTIQFGLLDLVTDISNICEFVKIDSKLIHRDPSDSIAARSDYTVPVSQLKIYTMYSDYASSNASANIVQLMDASYGKFFDASQLKSKSEKDITAEWLAVNAIEIDDAIYNTGNFFVIQGGKKGRCSKTSGLSNYFLQSIIQNNANSGILTSLKYAYYAVIKPRFLATALTRIYWENQQNFTNEDKETNNSVVYVLNTMSELAHNPTLTEDLSANGAADILSGQNGAEAPFSSDALRLYQTASIAYEIGKFVSKFGKSGSTNAKITTDLPKFNAGYPEYLKKISPEGADPLSSPFLFALKNPPDSNDCSYGVILAEGN